MADPQIPRGRATVWRPRAAGQGAHAQPWGGAALWRGLVQRLRAWALAETGPGQLVPWLAIAFGTGILLYFAAPREPMPAAPPLLFAAAAVLTVAVRRRPVAFPVMLVVTVMVAGFSASALKRAWVDHPVLVASAWNVDVAGFVEVREQRERSDRIVVRVHGLSGLRQGAVPDRVRISVRKGTAPPVGSFVTFKARLNPPLQPLRPGGYDFARDLYFQGIGASGFVLGRISLGDPPHPPAIGSRVAAAVGGLRDAVDARIRSVLPGDNGAIASALITGKRGAISADVNEAMYVSSLGHVLSISGYHMAVVAGVVFFALRALLALFPALATGYPIKKWAAAAALAAAAFYLVLSGAAVATQRAFIMVAIVLIGVMADRPALTLRTLTIAAFAVLLLAPESLIHPSFQMSFAATLVLIAAYSGGMSWTMGSADSSLGARVALWGLRQIAMLVIVSLLAGCATSLYAAYHFHRLAPYGILANLLAMPIVSTWVMPVGLLGLVALPFGFDGPLWSLMGTGVDWMIGVARWVASLPGAVGRIPAFGVAPLLLGSLGLVVISLLRTPLRYAGAALLAGAAVWAAFPTVPDVLVAGDGMSVAVRQADERLSVMRTGSDMFATRDWLAADGDGRDMQDVSLGHGIACDAAGCVTSLPDGRAVALVRLPEAFADDCRRAAIVVAARSAPPQGCAGRVIDRALLERIGAVALYRSGDALTIEGTRPSGYDRPWSRARQEAEEGPAGADTIRRRLPRDATPQPEDREADD